MILQKLYEVKNQAAPEHRSLGLWEFQNCPGDNWPGWFLLSVVSRDDWSWPSPWLAALPRTDLWSEETLSAALSPSLPFSGMQILPSRVPNAPHAGLSLLWQNRMTVAIIHGVQRAVCLEVTPFSLQNCTKYVYRQCQEYMLGQHLLYTAQLTLKCMGF